MKLVKVTWLDSFGCSTQWQEIDENLSPASVHCESVGFLAYESDEALVIVPHIARETKDTKLQGCGDMTIPRAAVVSIADLSSEKTEPVVTEEMVLAGFDHLADYEERGIHAFEALALIYLAMRNLEGDQ